MEAFNLTLHDVVYVMFTGLGLHSVGLVIAFFVGLQWDIVVGNLCNSSSVFETIFHN